MNKEIRKLFPIGGYGLKSVAIQTYDTTMSIKLEIISREDAISLTFDMPIHIDGILRLKMGDYKICKVLRNNPTYHPLHKELNQFYLISEDGILAECIRKVLERKLSDYHVFDTIIDVKDFETNLLSTIKMHNAVQWLPLTSKRYNDRIYIDIPQEDRESHNIIDNSYNVLDYSTQSQGSNVGLSMYMCKNVESHCGRIVARGETFSKIMGENTLFPEYSRRRITASNIESACEITHSEDPWCHHSSYDHTKVLANFNKPGTLHGKHLITAIVPYYTYKESICISADAAEKLGVSIPYQQVINVPISIENLKIVVEPGDLLDKGDVIARHKGKIKIGQTEDCYRCKQDNAYVSDIIKNKYKFGGKTYTRILFKYKSYHKLETGDKITNRAGSKGVVVIVDNDCMPEGVDVVMSPLAVAKRRNFGTLVEMMANEKAIKLNNFDMHYERFKKNWAKELYSEGYGQKSTHKWNGKEYNIYSAPVYWITLDKFAHKALKYVGKQRFLDSNKVPVDNGALSGTKLSISEWMQLITGKGWSKDLLNFLTKDIKKEGLWAINNYLNALE